jgi:hypothetical protein
MKQTNDMESVHRQMLPEVVFSLILKFNRKYYVSSVLYFANGELISMLPVLCTYFNSFKPRFQSLRSRNYDDGRESMEK